MPSYTQIHFTGCNGFLVRMFGQRDAAFFIESLLKTSASNVYLIGNVPGWPNALMAQHPSAEDASPTAVMNLPNMPPCHLWLLDFVPSPNFVVVPQKIWTPPNQSDWRRYVEQANLRMPVFFVQSDGSIGLPLTRATAGDTAMLHHAASPAPLGGGHSTQIRIAVSPTSTSTCLFLLFFPRLNSLVALQWPGYESWERQIQIRDQTRYRNEITLERFAKLVAGVVDRFLTVRLFVVFSSRINVRCADVPYLHFLCSTQPSWGSIIPGRSEKEGSIVTTLSL
jgi:hypothetical protein